MSEIEQRDICFVVNLVKQIFRASIECVVAVETALPSRRCPRNNLANAMHTTFECVIASPSFSLKRKLNFMFLTPLIYVFLETGSSYGMVNVLVRHCLPMHIRYQYMFVISSIILLIRWCYLVCVCVFVLFVRWIRNHFSSSLNMHASDISSTHIAIDHRFRHFYTKVRQSKCRVRHFCTCAYCMRAACLLPYIDYDFCRPSEIICVQYGYKLGTMQWI